MEQDTIKEHIQLWLSRRVGNGAVKELFDSSIAIGSDIGIVRRENQDRAVFVQVQSSVSKSFVIGVLCDGMGGMQAGAECASLSIASFIRSCINNRHLPVQARLIKAVEDANTAVYLKFKGEGGTTLSAFIFDNEGEFEAINVGDSRIYANTNQNIKQYSRDDTLAGQYENAAESHLSNRLLQYVGMGDEIEPHIVSLPSINNIKSLILTSDGAHYIEANTFKQILSQDLPALEFCKRIIHVSKWCGGHDNSTILIVNDLAEVFSKPSKSLIPTGTIKLWDSFGEIQFIGVTTSPSRRVRRKAIEKNNGDNELDLKVQKESTPAKSKTRRKRVEIKKANIDFKENKKESSVSKPQLRIDFE